MGAILVLAEHRKGQLRDITWEMLARGRQLAVNGQELIAVLLGHQVDSMVQQLAPKTDKVLVVDSKELECFNGEVQRRILLKLLKEYQPALTMVGHTACGMELIGQMDVPVVTDCTDLQFDGSVLRVFRQMYTGKVSAELSLVPAQGYLATIRPGSFPAEGATTGHGEIINLSLAVEPAQHKKFLEYIEAVAGEVDITRAELLVSVGQGIKDKKNIPLISDLADLMGGVMSCSRPIVDKKWLPKERQVGISGNTVKPKVYLAIGISGAFQHINEIKGGTIIAINKDPNAPIFRVADYGIVADLFQIVPALISRLKERQTTNRRKDDLS